MQLDKHKLIFVWVLFKPYIELEVMNTKNFEIMVEYIKYTSNTKLLLCISRYMTSIHRAIQFWLYFYLTKDFAIKPGHICFFTKWQQKAWVMNSFRQLEEKRFNEWNNEENGEE